MEGSLEDTARLEEDMDHLQVTAGTVIVIGVRQWVTTMALQPDKMIVIVGIGHVLVNVITIHHGPGVVVEGVEDRTAHRGGNAIGIPTTMIMEVDALEGKGMTEATIVVGIRWCISGAFCKGRVRKNIHYARGVGEFVLSAT